MRKIRLTPRLQAIAEKIPSGSVVADIGTDHAYIPVYLLTNRIASHVIASDNKEGPLRAAAETIQLFNVEKAVDLRLGNGLEVLKQDDDVDVLVIAGMGGETVSAVLAQGEHLPKRLVLQPMTEAGMVRSWLLANGFSIIQEDIAWEDNFYYEIIIAEFVGGALPRLENLEIGPCLLADKHPLFKPMLEQRVVRLRKAAQGAASSNTPAARQRVAQLNERITNLEEVLACL